MFKVGSKIVTVQDFDGLPKGSVGIVVDTFNSYIRVMSTPKKGWRGHNCGGLCPNNDGYWVPSYLWQLLPTTPFEQDLSDYIQRELPNPG